MKTKIYENLIAVNEDTLFVGGLQKVTDIQAKDKYMEIVFVDGSFNDREMIKTKKATITRQSFADDAHINGELLVNKLFDYMDLEIVNKQLITEVR